MRAIEAIEILREMPEISRRIEHAVHVGGEQRDHLARRLGIPMAELVGHLDAAREARTRWANTIARDSSTAPGHVTDREILAALADGMSREEVAEELGVTGRRVAAAVCLARQSAKFSKPGTAAHTPKESPASE